MDTFISKVCLEQLNKEQGYPKKDYYIQLDKGGEDTSYLWTDNPLQTLARLQRLCLSDSLGLFNEKGEVIRSPSLYRPTGWTLSLFHDHRLLENKEDFLTYPANNDLVLTLHFYNGKTAIEIIEVREGIDLTKPRNERSNRSIGSERGMIARSKSPTNTPFTAVEYFGDGMLEEYFIEAGKAASVIREYVSNGTFSSLVDWVEEE